MMSHVGELDIPNEPFMYVNEEGMGFTVCISAEKLDSKVDIISVKFCVFLNENEYVIIVSPLNRLCML